MSFTHWKVKEKCKASAARAAGKRTAPIGVSINQYASARHVSKWKAGLHRDNNANFPKPVAIVGAIRKLRYYNEKELEVYFATAEGFDNKEEEKNSVKPATLLHRFITTNWTGQEISKKCSLAEDGPEL
jgi:hypothetical protein